MRQPCVPRLTITLSNGSQLLGTPLQVDTSVSFKNAVSPAFFTQCTESYVPRDAHVVLFELAHNLWGCLLEVAPSVAPQLGSLTPWACWKWPRQWRHSSAARPPRADPLGARFLHALRRRALALQSVSGGAAAAARPCQRRPFASVQHHPGGATPTRR